MASIGTLIKLPTEMRSAIFEECLKQRSIGLLVANKQLYEEFIIHLRQLFILSLHVDPVLNQTVLHVLNADGEPWGSRRSLESSHINTELFKGMRLDTIRAIKITIDPTNPQDPGQLVRAWLLVTRLVTALSPIWKDPHSVPSGTNDVFCPFYSGAQEDNRLPPVHVQFREEPKRRWCDRNLVYYQSIPSWKEWSSTPEERLQNSQRRPEDSDINILLMPFRRTRTKRLRIELPAHRPVNECVVDEHINRLRVSTTSSDLFGLCAGAPSQNEQDEFAMKEEGAMSLWIDYLLDDMKGRTARYLRRDRSESWCDRYERHLGHCLFGYWQGDELVGGAAGIFDESLTRAIQASFNQRYWSHSDSFAKVFELWRCTGRCLARGWREIYHRGITRSSVLYGGARISIGQWDLASLTFFIVTSNVSLRTGAFWDPGAFCILCYSGQ